MYCYWQVFGRCALILVKPTIRGSTGRQTTDGKSEELPDRTWYHETSACVDEGSGSSLERLGSKYMNKKENLQSERDRERGGGSHRETDAELQNTPIMGRAVSLQSEQETQSDRLCGAGLRPRK